ncbi:hypothetical protein L1987_25464 [Smallanthus sonchifolius]|uniref:Uncharacterized protein n=2 Tax=Smallanthus sonchifolius TaxID=185202 RepID=A0ACB9IP96_9ASTR|nr:hypothetical protein L1987_57787 [Smallanthus sonchifolius]KAI3809488.1 hypothetical protein L1987_25464 [Smallanthus sonchifolius]
MVRRSEAFSGEHPDRAVPCTSTPDKSFPGLVSPTRTKGPDQLVSPTYGSSNPVGGRKPTPRFRADSQPPRVLDSSLASSRPDECPDTLNFIFHYKDWATP